MTAKPGNYTIDNSNGKLLIHTGRAGMASKVGHDLVIEATRWNATVNVDGDPSQSEVTATIDARSLEVREGHGGAKPLTDKDRKDIKSNMFDVLKISSASDIKFQSNSVEANGDRITVSGDLTVAGASQPVTLQLTMEDGGDTVRLRGETEVVQSKWGIKPFSAMMGALKVKDEVKITLDVELPAG